MRLPAPDEGIEIAAEPAVPVRPVSLPFALALFGVPGFVIYLATHVIVPEVVDRGVPLVFAWTAAVVFPTVANALFVLGYYS